MDTYDIKKVSPMLYAPKPGDFHVVEVPRAVVPHDRRAWRPQRLTCLRRGRRGVFPFPTRFARPRRANSGGCIPWGHSKDCGAPSTQPRSLPGTRVLGTGRW